MKLRNKLILSCAALAAVATTAVSTTYAWYTSNTTVSASNINATTAASGADLLLIADGIAVDTSTATPSYSAIAVENLQWKQQLEPTVTANELKPLAYNSADKILVADTVNNPTVTLEGVEGAPSEVAWNDSTAAYATVVLYFKNASTSSTDVYLKTLEVKHPETISDNAAYDANYTLPAKSIVDLDANFASFGFTKNAQGVISHNTPIYTVDALRVLQFDVTATQDGTAEGDTDYAAPTEVVYDIEANTTRIADDLGATFNAHTYYNAIMDTDLTITTDNTSKTVLNGTGTTANKAVKIGKVPAAGTAASINHVLKVEFKIFLNGWDLACFDACQAQNFVINMEFTSDAPNGTRTYVVTA